MNCWKFCNLERIYHGYYYKGISVICGKLNIIKFQIFNLNSVTVSLLLVC